MESPIENIAGHQIKAIATRYCSQRVARQLVFRALSCLHSGTMIVIEDDGQREVFKGDVCGPNVTVRIHDGSFYPRLLRGGSLALGECYVEGLWDVDGDLKSFFNLIFSNRIEFAWRDSFIKRTLRLLSGVRSLRRSLKVSKHNVEFHYNLGNEFYEKFLDESMTYSCGYAHSDDDSIETMQRQKFELIGRKLGLEKGGRLLDIGCGWGAFMLFAASHYPSLHCRGITLSTAQRDLALARTKEQGLERRVTVELKDFREIEGRYDYVVSIGMFEHVGRKAARDFMNVCSRSLTPAGAGLLHTIGLEEDPAQMQDAWVERYIFPGSRLPRLEEIASDMRNNGLQIAHIENLRPHYAITLKRWYDRFKVRWHEIRNLSPNFNDRFYRMWSYYLKICEACFINSTMELYQVVFSRRGGWPFPRCLRF